MNYKLNAIYKIEWNDTFTITDENDETALEMLKNSVYCISVGILFCISENYILLKQNNFHNLENPHNDYIAIPKACIKSARILK